MFYWNGRSILFGIILACFLTDISCNEFDPLPAGVRSVISSNHLSESTPEVFAEYHALLPNFRGDYGIKSKLVEAATKEPIYKGSDTFILPLYIPKGAIPFPVHDRTTRSGSASGQPNMRILRGPTPSVRNVHRDLNRPILRRTLPTNRRHLTPRHNPTPPPSFIRQWIRSRGGPARASSNPDDTAASQNAKAAHSRKGLIPTASESVGRISVSEPDNSKITRKKVTITPLRRPNARITTPSTANYTANSNSTNPQFFESKRKITKIIHKVFSTTISPNVSLDVKTEKEPAKISDAKLKPEPVDKSRPVRIKPMMPMKPEERKIALHEARYSAESTTETSSKSTSEASVTRLRHPAITIDSNSKSLKSSIEITNEDAKTTPKTTSTSTSFLISSEPLTKETTTSTQPIFPLISTTEASESDEFNKYIASSTPASNRYKNSTDFQKTAAWLLRRRASLRKRNRNGSISLKTKAPGKKNQDDHPNESRAKASGSIIDRVLSSAASQTDSTTSNSFKELKTDLQKHDVETTTVPERKRKPPYPKLSSTLNERRYNSRPEGQRKVPRLAFNRPRVPIRVRNPVVSNSRAAPKVTTEANRGNNSSASESKVEEIQRNTGPSESEENSFSTNSITTSTPKLPWIGSINPSSKTKISGTSKKPFIEPFRTPSSPIHMRKSSLDPLEQSPSLVKTPRLRNAQEIVLEKLSKLMADATNKSKSVDDIARELEVLNRELSQLGIHIIDAEFGGHKLKLKDYGIDPNVRRPPTNSSRLFQNSGSDIHYSGDNIYGNSRSPSYPYKHELPGKDVNKSSFVPKIRENSQTLPKKFQDEHRMKSTPQNDMKQIKDDRISQVLSTTLPIFVKSDVRPENGDDGPISATSTLSPSVVTRTRTTAIPLMETINSEDDNHSSILDWQTRATEDDQPQEEKIGSSSASPVLTTPKAPTRRPILKSSNHPSQSSPADLPKTTPKSIIIERVQEEIPKQSDGLELNENIINLLASNEQLPSYGSNEKSSGVQTDQIDNLPEDESYVYLFGLFGIVPFAVLFFLLYRQRKNRQEKALPQREVDTDGFTPPTNHVRSSALTGTLDTVPPFLGDSQTDSPWEFPRSKLRLTSIIGEGNFGMVWKAEARNLCDWDEEGDGPTVLVAVKGVKEGAGAKEKSDLLRELSIMQLLGQHNNIVTLLGCCTTHEPHFLVMEYVMFGKLLTFLRDHRSRSNYYNFSSDTDHLTSRDLTKFACQIATGCDYLQSRGVIHRDLAARNILVDHNKVCKIADFGLARSVKDLESDIYEQKSRGPLPIRWMAPESLYMSIFTHKSDVWSFGILCWEIVTLGSTPYPGVSAREVMRRVREGYRLERPEHCHTEFYQIITQCWNQDLNKRPSFTELKEDIKDLLESATTRWIDLENFQEATYYSMHENNDEKL